MIINIQMFILYYALMILRFIICWKKFSYKMYATSIHSAMHVAFGTIYTDSITTWTQGGEKCIFENLYYIYYTFIEKHRIFLCIF